MVESMVGEGAVREVERELRSKVEFEVNNEAMRRERGREQMGEMKDKAQTLYRDLSERINMKCPRCDVVFNEYDGCNALTCWNVSCKAAICAICLEDCGSDAHNHVRTSHGDLFDKTSFYRAKKERELSTVRVFMNEIDDEPFEVKELVRIEYEKANGDQLSPASGSGRNRDFLVTAESCLRNTVRSDRLSLLYDESNVIRTGFCVEAISPRNAIPDDFKLSLRITCNDNVYEIKLQRLDRGTWRKVALPSDEADSVKEGTELKIDALVNLRRTLQCGVIAFQGGRRLYQSTTVRPKKDCSLGDEDVCIVFRPVSREGDLVGEELSLSSIEHDGEDILDERRIIGVNQNRRLLLLEEHVKKTDPSELMFAPLRHFIGNGTPERVFTEIACPSPDTFQDLNPRQRSVAHPLALTTAKEVAGPPGSGKTKTITELVRAIVECTDYDVIVLSERNGAIDAIAEKLAGDCIERVSPEATKVKDIRLWTNVLAFGSSGGIGISTKLFTLTDKLR
jgi:hypothetical protein